MIASVGEEISKKYYSILGQPGKEFCRESAAPFFFGLIQTRVPGGSRQGKLPQNAHCLHVAGQPADLA